MFYRKEVIMAKRAPKSLVVSFDVIVVKDAKGESAIDVSKARVVEPSEVTSAINVAQNLCLNICAGTVHPDIVEAHNKKGGIVRLFPAMSNPDRDALRKLLDATPEAIRAGWAAHVAKTKRIRAISLQALKKAIAEPKVKSDTKSLREQLEEFCGAHTAWVNSEACPAELFDILADLLPSEDSEV
jgi:hypothetical protein